MTVLETARLLLSRLSYDALADADNDTSVRLLERLGFVYERKVRMPEDAIWREVELARRAGKPLIVSMAGIAASGGYFVAAPAHKIVALPGTLTGSIGVVSGKLVLTGLWHKLGIAWDGFRHQLSRQTAM